MTSSHPSPGFWISIEGTHWGYVHIPCPNRMLAVDLDTMIKLSKQDKQVTIMLAEFV